MKNIVLTGGGTAGHVTPNLALIPRLKEDGWTISYIGTKDGIERGLIEREGVQYYPISSGKLRRYVSLKNVTDLFRVVKGINEASKIIKKLKPDIIFSKGGFVAVPVVFGAKRNKVPILVHESDMTPGLANKIAIPFAAKVLTTIPETAKLIPKAKGINTGSPIRPELFLGSLEKGYTVCGFQNDKPVIMMMGGSLGSVKINTVLREALPELLKDFQLVHICGKGNLDGSKKNLKGYCQLEYVGKDLPHIFKMAELVISRAGSNSICEFLALKKPNLLIPLSLAASRGDQILNAESFEKQGFSMVLKEEDMTVESLKKQIYLLYKDRQKYRTAMKDSHISDGLESVLKWINQYQGV